MRPHSPIEYMNLYSVEYELLVDNPEAYWILYDYYLDNNWADSELQLVYYLNPYLSAAGSYLRMYQWWTNVGSSGDYVSSIAGRARYGRSRSRSSMGLRFGTENALIGNEADEQEY